MGYTFGQPKHKQYGDTIHGLKEYEEWQKNYGTLVESIGATYAYAVPYHY